MLDLEPHGPLPSQIYRRRRFAAIGIAAVASALVVGIVAIGVLLLVIGGAIGNVIDRLQYGHVIDFIQWYWRDYYWPAFNIADSAIVGGAIGIALFGLIDGKKRGKPSPREAGRGTGSRSEPG